MVIPRWLLKIGSENLSKDKFSSVSPVQDKQKLEEKIVGSFEKSKGEIFLVTGR